LTQSIRAGGDAARRSCNPSRIRWKIASCVGCYAQLLA